jgi:hypothetical protein
MAQHDTQAQRSATRLDQRTAVIFPICYIDAVTSASVLSKHRDMAIDRAKAYHTAYTKAMWSGICALNTEAHDCLHRAIARGQLLLCWEGSTVMLLDKITEEAAA